MVDRYVVIDRGEGVPEGMVEDFIEKTYRCKKCGFETDSITVIRNHVNKEHDIRDYIEMSTDTDIENDVERMVTEVMNEGECDEG